MSINENIADFATTDGNGDGTYTVTRNATGSTTKGRYTPGTPSTFPIVAVVEPVGGQLQVVPEGRRATDVRKIFTATRLLIEPDPDAITIGGETFIVYDVQGPWELDGDSHYECLAARQAVP